MRSKTVMGSSVTRLVSCGPPLLLTAASISAAGKSKTSPCASVTVSSTPTYPLFSQSLAMRLISIR